MKPIDRIAAALERIATSLELAGPGARRDTKPGKRKRAKPTFHPPRLVEVDDVSKERARKALRRAGV